MVFLIQSLTEGGPHPKMLKTADLLDTMFAISTLLYK